MKDRSVLSKSLKASIVAVTLLVVQAYSADIPTTGMMSSSSPSSRPPKLLQVNRLNPSQFSQVRIQDVYASFYDDGAWA